ncbi:Putative N-acetylmuramoyl-L-alanine amidase RC0497 [Frankliniella fusca]|uniref:N-acetylmuramoyl-L-alanine amidase RC0497 n=1 Tax=Frankliniella fusca TaxID=407009 RepID=A0AAE1LFI1_9NEOP|nr:Putative N-acetylmuramoyl-L-alanine amidase RC0497 [Frankliniella fusca]
MKEFGDKLTLTDVCLAKQDYADVLQRVDVCLQPLPKTWGSFRRPRQEALKDAEYAIRHGFAKEKIIRVIDERMAIYHFIIDGTMRATVDECLYASLP